MTTTKPPVLTDEERAAIIDRAQDEPWATCDDIARAIEQAVLERAGADAVRDSALEEAVRDLEKRRALLRGQYESVNIMEADAMYGLCIEAIRALKGTPAAAVEDAEHCTYCDGTGDVHGFDGEWRGVCTECDAGKQLSGNAGEVDAKDAERYRWIAENAEVVFDKPVKFQQTINYQAFTRIPDRPYLSRAIDAAIAASKGANHD